MKKIVIVSALQIFKPLSGGQLRTANLALALNELTKHQSCEILIYSFTGRKNEYLRFAKSEFVKITPQLTEYVNRNLVFGVIQRLFYIFQWPPLWIYWLLKFWIPAHLKSELVACDLVISDFPYLSPIFKNLKCKKWLNTHNAEYELWTKNPRLSRKIQSLELTAMNMADHVLFCSETDRHKFTILDSRIDKKSSLVSNGVRPARRFESDQQRAQFRSQLGIKQDHRVFLFTASQFGPNIEAFEFLKIFCSKNAKVLTERKIVILVVGTVSNQKIDSEHFKVTGRVDEIDPYLMAADFGLNPVQQGSGVNVKMMEFLSANIPILSTEVGARGLSLVPDVDYFSVTYENLLSKLLLAVEVDSETMKSMAQASRNQNEMQLDMSRSLQKLLSNQ